MTPLSAIVVGNESLLRHCTQRLLDRGHEVRAVITRDPDLTRWATDAGLRVEHVAMDADGLVPEALRERIRRLEADGRQPRMLYTVPNFQNPMGVTLAPERRPEIVDICREAGIPIVSEMGFGHDPDAPSMPLGVTVTLEAPADGRPRMRVDRA